MTYRQAPRWRWSNVPIPEPYIAGLIGGMVVDVLLPERLLENRRLTRTVGGGLTGLGLLIISWTVRTVGAEELEQSTALVTTGPYAFSRNPMYIGWAVLYLGVAMIRNTAWLLVAFPLVVASCHRIIHREEQSLEYEFGSAYRTYRTEVPRYL